jgi:hypothetical protein
MQDPVLREEMEDFYNYLQRILIHEGVVIPSENYDLALDIMPSEDGQIQWSYYYACHGTRCLFWLDTYNASHMISELFGVKSPAHVSASQISFLNILSVSTNLVHRASTRGSVLVRQLLRRLDLMYTLIFSC